MRKTAGLAILAGAWWVFALCACAFAVSTPGSALRDERLPPLLRLSLHALELVVLVLPVALLIGGPLLLGRFRALRRILLVLGAALLWAWYLASWGLFRRTGAFLGSDAAAMLLTDTRQMIQHVAQLEPWSLIAFPLVVLAAAVLTGTLLTRRFGGLAPGAAGGLVRASAVTLLVLAAAGLAGEWVGGRSEARVYDPASGSWYEVSRLQAVVRDRRAGPASLLLAELLRERPQLVAAEEVGSLRIVRPPQISLAEWAAAVDGSSLRRWNVLVVLVESLRCDQLTPCGAELEVLPAVEALAREGRVFVNCRTQASMSSYADPCPLSSHYPLRSNVTHFYPKDPAYPRVPIYDLLSQLGWRTAIFSSQNENWGQMLNYLDTGRLDKILHAETYEGETYVPHDDGFFAGWVKGEKRAGKIDDRFTVDSALEWIRGGDGRPFFIYMNLQNSHVPFTVPAGFPRRFGPDRIDFPLTFGSFPRERQTEVVGRYRDSLAYADAQLARLFASLRESGEWERTVVAVTGDTGQAFYEHGFAGHANELYDEVMRVPLVVRAPGLEPGVDDFPAQHVDLPPSILHLLGLPLHPGHQGIDLFSPERSPERSVYLLVQTQHAHQYAVVREGWKLIWDAPSQRPLLYDLAADPGETADLAAARPDVGQRLAERLLAWQRAQLEYYSDPQRQAREYPPVILP